MTQEQIEKILAEHKAWLRGTGGTKANLHYANLCDADLRNANLHYADLRDADLCGADLRDLDLFGANLCGANLCSADLFDADLRDACLRNADLHYANLSGADLSCADLRDANLSGADLSCADLFGANLCDADLCGADLYNADLCGANLSCADLRDADLCGANLCGAHLCGSNLKGVRYNEKTACYAMQCPEKGAYIGYKKAEGKIVELEIQEDAKRSSATTRKCRASKAKVLSITSIDGKEHFEEAKSNNDQAFVYKVGEIVEVKDFDEDRWNECSSGIHHFITREEAERY